MDKAELRRLAEECPGTRIMVEDEIILALLDEIEHLKETTLTPLDLAKIQIRFTEMAAKIESMKCCGNCKAYRFQILNVPMQITKSIVDGKIVYNASTEVPVIEMICHGVDGSGKCDRWEALK